MILRIRNSRWSRGLALGLVLSFLFQIGFPTGALALTGGPSQPEVNSFTPIGTTDMVDLFTGDFNYNIPLLDVGGYPINLAYSGQPTMDTEASMVGLGWNLNPGAIKRNMRGMPDDFNGDEITKELNMRPNRTFNINANLGLESFNIDITKKAKQIAKIDIQLGAGISYNNYNGLSLSTNTGLSLSPTSESSNTAGLGLNVGASDGSLNISPSVSFSRKTKNKQYADKIRGSVGVGLNSRQGLTSVNLSASRTNRNGLIVKKKEMYSASSSSFSYSFIANTYTPSFDMPKTTFGMTGSFHLGLGVAGQDGGLTISGGYTSEWLSKKSLSHPAFGYMNAQNGFNNDAAVLDFNRENEMATSRHLPNMYMTNHTFDMFSISGQGVGGTLRPHRSDVGYMRKPKVTSTSVGAKFGVEFNGGWIADVGVDAGIHQTKSHSGMWQIDNTARSNFRFERERPNDTYEPFYFRQVGDLSVDEEFVISNNLSSGKSLFEKVGQFRPVQIPLSTKFWDPFAVQARASDGYRSKTGETYKQTNNKRTKRVKRNQMVSYLNRKQAKKLAVTPYSYPHGEDHHLAEMTVLKNDGTRYVYGLPAYNHVQKEVSFNISHSSADCYTGLVNYEYSDASIGNKRGRDWYFQSQKLPEFAHSYLLTSVLSPDYVDRTGNGPTRDDYGNFTRLNYGTFISNYKWRVPYQQNKANYSAGLKSDLGDDRGSYLYGTKDVLYVSSIETKTHVANFHMSGRRDGFEASGEHGGQGNRSMKKLDKISLYSIGLDGARSLIKEVHFQYSYKLCPNIPNNKAGTDIDNPVNEGGKLTLERVYFTHARSKKGAISDYRFAYADSDHDQKINSAENPSYNLKGYNSWGGYKPQAAGAGCNTKDKATNPEFPFVGQKKPEQDIYANAWCLSSIHLPSGGRIDIDREADDYAYVQNKQAMQMFKVVGTGDEDGPNQGSKLYNGSAPVEYLYLDISDYHKSSNDKSLKSGISKYDFLGKIGKGEKLYFRFLTRIDNASKYDYVEGYLPCNPAEWEEPALVNGMLRLKINPEKIDWKDVGKPNANPIAKAAWNFSRTYLPRVAYNLPDPQEAQGLDNPGIEKIKNVMKAIANAKLVSAVINAFRGPNRVLRSMGYCKSFHPDKSWVRLMNPDYKKIGGGARIKKIAMRDNWNEMSDGGEDAAYGQEYDYSMEVNGRKISSGVATYEPIGSKDNPWIMPEAYEEQRLLAPNKEHYMETPFGESFFPSPSVGYRKVKVRNLKPADPDIKVNGTGHVEHEFYTAYDYPVITDRTGLRNVTKKSLPLASLLNLSTKSHLTQSQGFCVQINDMHGKPKSQYVYPEGKNTYISGTDYVYHQNAVDISASPTGDIFENYNLKNGHLNNEVTVIHKNGLLSKSQVGVTFDIVNDFNESETQTESLAFTKDAIFFMAWIIPIKLIPYYPQFKRSNTRYRAAGTTKVIQRTGILREVVHHDAGAHVSTKNLAWDAETGEVLLKETTNEFGDKVYDFSYPAHWAYDGMGQAYKNINVPLELVTTNTTSGEVQLSFANWSSTGAKPKTADLLQEGDELALSLPGQGLRRAWVLKTNYGNQERFHLVDRQGQPIVGPLLSSGEYMSARVIRSGYRNQQSLSIGSVTTLVNPIDYDNDGKINKYLKFHSSGSHGSGVLQAQATEFSDRWRNFKGYEECIGAGSDNLIDPDEEHMAAHGLKLCDFLNELERKGHLFKGDDQYAEDIIVNDHLAFSKFLFEGLVHGDLSKLGIIRRFGRVDVGANRRTWGLKFRGSYRPPYPLECDDVTSAKRTSKSRSSFNIRSRNRTTCYCEYELVFTRFAEPVDDWEKHIKNLSSFQYSGSTVESGLLTHRLIARDKVNGALRMLKWRPIDKNCGEQELPCQPKKCGTQVGDVVNPYVEAMRGIYRPSRNSLYLVERTQKPTNTGKNDQHVRADGSYVKFSPFWQSYGSGFRSDNENWTWSSEVTNFHPVGAEVENRDRLGRYSAALFGFNGTKPVAVASNATYRKIAVLGFEDVNAFSILNDGSTRPSPLMMKTPESEGTRGSDAECSEQDHFEFGLNNKVFISNYGHTGRHCLQLVSGGETSCIRSLKTKPTFPEKDNAPYTFKADDDLGLFGPETYDTRFNVGVQESPVAQSNKYVISYWIREDNPSNSPLANVLDVFRKIEIITADGSSQELPIQSIAKSPIIDGWQKVDRTFIIPGDNSGADKLIKFTIGGHPFLNYNIYFDDMRIHPFNAGFKSYTYDNKTLQLSAELDDRNFATFYEYDQAGNLIRIKKETERGIVTIQESRTELFKKGH